MGVRRASFGVGSRACALIAIAALVLCFSVRVEATSVKPMSMREIADLSAQVCWATVASTSSRWASDRHEIETVVQLCEVAYLKGSGPSAFEWIVPGGTMNGMTMQLAGAPSFVAGERWMLCLLPSWKTHPCAGIWQGAFRLEQGKDGAVVRGAGGLVTGLNPDSSVRYARSQRTHTCSSAACAQPHRADLSTRAVDPAMTSEAWNAALQPILGASTPRPLPEGLVVAPRIWIDSRAVPFQTSSGRPLNAPAKVARTGATRPKWKLLPASPKGASR